MRPEVQALLKFLYEHTEAEIRQGVLRRTEVGIQFLVLQKNALKRQKESERCNTATPEKNTAHDVDKSLGQT